MRLVSWFPFRVHKVASRRYNSRSTRSSSGACSRGTPHPGPRTGVWQRYPAPEAGSRQHLLYSLELQLRSPRSHASYSMHSSCFSRLVLQSNLPGQKTTGHPNHTSGLWDDKYYPTRAPSSYKRIAKARNRDNLISKPTFTSTDSAIRQPELATTALRGRRYPPPCTSSIEEDRLGEIPIAITTTTGAPPP